MTYVVRLPNDMVLSLNKVLDFASGPRYAIKNKYKKLKFMGESSNPPDGRADLKIGYYTVQGRAYDADNYGYVNKCIIDAMRDKKLLQDDDRRFVRSVLTYHLEVDRPKHLDDEERAMGTRFLVYIEVIPIG